MDMDLDSSEDWNLAEIFSNYLKGQSVEYDILTNKLSRSNIEPEFLAEFLKHLNGCVGMLDSRFKDFVHLVLKLDWASSSNADVIEQYQAFVLHLVQRHTNSYVHICIISVLKNFSPVYTLPNESPDEVLTRHTDKFAHLHRLLQNIFKCVPSSIGLCFDSRPGFNALPLIVQHMPYLKKPCAFHKCYVYNLLRIMGYLPSHASNIMLLIVNHMIEFDVRVPRQLIQEKQAEVDTVFEMDVDEVPGTASAMKNSIGIHEADCLDELMHLLYQHIQTTCCTKEGLNWTDTRTLYKLLLLTFDRIILPVHGPCHVHFLIFYICSLKKTLSDGFLDYLLRKFMDLSTSRILRQNAITYVASFLARAKFVSLETMKDAVMVIAGFIHRYIAQSEDRSNLTNIKCHGAFYAACQGLFYVLAFRAEQLFATKEGLKFAHLLNLQSIVTCRLNPLRVCMPIVIHLFANVSRQHQLAFCDTVIEHNRRSMLTISDEGYNTKPENPLDTFFPFDPYQLKKCVKKINKIYRQYRMPIAEEEWKETLDLDEEEEIYDRSQDKHCTDPIALALAQSLPDSKTDTQDLINYGTSPGFKHVR